MRVLVNLMDSTEAIEDNGWDVEVFIDSFDSRLAWFEEEDSTNGSDRTEFRKYIKDDLSVFGFKNKFEAREYIEELNTIHSVTKLEDLSSL